MADRLFLALWPTPAAREQAAAVQAALPWPARARRTREERLHVTVHFLGAIDDATTRELETALAVPWAPFDIIFDHLAVFPGGIAVLGTREVPAGLRALHEALGERLSACGVALETRAYRPHVTLARQAHGLPTAVNIQPLVWPVRDGYSLVRSLSGGRGYEDIARFA